MNTTSVKSTRVFRNYSKAKVELTEEQIKIRNNNIFKARIMERHLPEVTEEFHISSDRAKQIISKQQRTLIRAIELNYLAHPIKDLIKVTPVLFEGKPTGYHQIIPISTEDQSKDFLVFCKKHSEVVFDFIDKFL